MAFPTVTHRFSGGSTTDVGYYNMVLPSDIAPGSMIFIFVTIDGNPSSTIVNGDASASNWVISNPRANLANEVVSYLVWTMSALGNGLDKIPLYSPANEKHGFIGYVVTGHDSAVAPEFTRYTNYMGPNDANPPTLTPTWGEDDTLWIAGLSTDYDPIVSASPTGYTNLTVFTGNTLEHSGHVTSAERQLRAATNDPDKFTIDPGGTRGTVWNIAIKPTSAAPVININYGSLLSFF